MSATETLHDKRIVVVGAAGGLGAAASRHLRATGARLVLVDAGLDPTGRGVDAAHLDAYRRAWPDGDPFAERLELDATLPDAAAQAFGAAERRWGGADGLLWLAGIDREASVLQLDPADFNAMLDVGVRAPLAFLQALARDCIRRGSGGAALLLASPQAPFGVAKQVALSTVGAALLGLARTAATEFRRHSVRVNVLAPIARTRTNAALPMFQGVGARSLSVDQVSPVIEFLLSDAAANVTGEFIGAGGGRVYAVRSRETTGVTADGAPTAALLANAWGDVIRA